MSDLIRMLGMGMSNGGTCNKCGISRKIGNHAKCDRWPSGNGISSGFHYVSNAKESNLADLKLVIESICAGDPDDTPVRFDLKIMQTRSHPDNDEGNA